MEEVVGSIPTRSTIAFFPTKTPAAAKFRVDRLPRLPEIRLVTRQIIPPMSTIVCVRFATLDALRTIQGTLYERTHDRHRLCLRNSVSRRFRTDATALNGDDARRRHHRHPS